MGDELAAEHRASEMKAGERTHCERMHQSTAVAGCATSALHPLITEPRHGYSAPPDERVDDRQTNPTAAAPHPDSTDTGGRRPRAVHPASNGLPAFRTFN